jgi:GNAT superfamily N-acetyltransferase
LQGPGKFTQVILNDTFPIKSVNMTLVVRKARANDSDAFLSLVRALAKFEKLDPPSYSARQRLLKDTFSTKKLKLLLAFSDKTPVAYALYFFTYSSFLARPTLYLEDLFVLEDFRRMQIGKSLFLYLAKEARRLHCGRMEWAVLTWNKNAIGFYERLDAKRLDQWLHYRLDRKGIEALAKK